MKLSRNSNAIQWDWKCRFILMVFLWKRPWNCHGIWRHFLSKLRWESMMAFYYEGAPCYAPCKKWILMEIPCHFMSQIDRRSLVQIDTEFHDYSMSFIQVLFSFHAQTWHGFWTSSSHGISMAFAKKMMGFPSDLVSFSNQTKLPSIWRAKIRVTFFTGLTRMWGYVGV